MFFRLFFRLLFMFFCLDIVLSILALTGSFLWGETRAAGVAELVEERGVPSQEAIQWMQAVDYSITPLEQMPELSRQWDLLKYYQVNFPNSGEPYSVTIDMTGLGAFLRWGAVIILSAEGIILICNLFSNAGIIRKTLRPIQELAATAKRLNSMTHMSKREIESLAGELGKIDAAHLDSRIDLPGTQKELRALAQAINEMMDRVHQAYGAQMRFVSDASHELRTPIAVIQGYAALLDRWGKSDPEALQESIDAIRGEAASGFASARQWALPVLEEFSGRSYPENDVHLHALLHLMANVCDTNILARGGPEGLDYLHASAKEVLALGGALTPAGKARLGKLDGEFTRRGLSPGGCADLLAVAIFLHRLPSLAGGGEGSLCR